MGKRYTHAHTIKFYECDTTGELTLPMVLNIVIQASEDRVNNWVVLRITFIA